MLVSFMSFQLRIKFQWEFNLGDGKHQVAHTKMQESNENI